MLDILPLERDRKIIHIDMDCFFAAIEMRANPHWCSLPLAVGGSAQERGVLSACNYVARKYGLRSGMSTALAQRKCPALVLLPVRMQAYHEVSLRIQKILQRYSQRIEASLDEAYLDVTGASVYQGSATRIAEAIRRDIYESEKLTASAGVAPNKLLAKIASDWRKPNGLHVVVPSAVPDFMLQLPIQKIPGVGQRSAEKLHHLGVYTCGQLQTLACPVLIQLFGRFGYTLYLLCRGIDTSPVEPDCAPKSLGVEETFPRDLDDLNSCQLPLRLLCQELTRRLKAHRDKRINKIFVKIKFHNFQLTSVERTYNQVQLAVYQNLLKIAYERGKASVRLIGLGVHFAEENHFTLPLPFN